MKFILPTFAALVAPLLAQSITTPPVATSTNDWVGPPWASSDPAKWSSIYSSLVSAGKIPSTLTAAPWATGTWGPGSGPWGGSDGRGGGPGGRGGWGGQNGPGPWGSSNYGPWSEWSTRSDWRSAPWTAWWDGSACPASDWPGWTAGPWSTNAPWTTWSACTASTTATSTVTSTVNGTAVVGTAYGLKVAAASADPTTTSGSAGAAPLNTAGVGMAMGAVAVFGFAVGL